MLKTTLSHRIMASALIFAFFWVSCDPSPNGMQTPIVPSKAPPTTQSQESSGGRSSALSEDDAMDIGASELARYMEREFGPEWVSVTQRLLSRKWLDGADIPDDAAFFLYDLMRSAIEARPAEDVAYDSEAHSSFRTSLRTALESGMDSDIQHAGTIARTPAPPDDPLNFGDETCDEYESCIGRNMNECYAFADLEVSLHETWLMAGCLFLGALGTVVTLNPAAAVASVVFCTMAPSYWSALVHSNAMDECFTTRCGYYPSCI